MDADRLHKLLDLYVDEGLAAAEHTELEEMLLSSSRAREIFWERAQFNALLREFGTQTWGRRAAARAETEPKKRSSIPWKPVAWLVAACLLLGGLALAWRMWPPLAEPTTDGVAMLGQTVEAVWADGEPERTPGAVLGPGWLRLTSGFAQIELVSGARVVLEGPADLQLISPLEVFCRVGRLRADVPPQASGFRVGAPPVAVVDQGTAFGIDVQGSGATEIHVLSGAVELQRGTKTQTVLAGRSVHVDPDGAFRDLTAAPPEYPSYELLEARAANAWRQRHEAWLTASQRIATLPGLRLYFTFELDSPGVRTLPNLSLAPNRAPDGSIVGCRLGEGRWPGKRAFEFGAVTDRVRLSVPGELTSFTLAASVRVDGLDRTFTSLLMCDGWEEGDVHWQINKEGSLILGVQGSKGRASYDYRTRPAFPPERLAQWVQLAVVFDRAARRVSHYVDGEQLSSEAMRPDSEHPICFDYAEIGNWNYAKRMDRSPIRNLNGRMDELLIFDRALSAAEVQNLSRAAQP